MKFSAALGRAARPHQPVAEDVLLADDGGVVRSRSRIRCRARRAPRACLGRPAPAARRRPASDCAACGRRARGSCARARPRSTARWRRACPRPAAPSRACVTASNTLAPGSARSAAKLRPARAPTSITSARFRHRKGRQPAPAPRCRAARAIRLRRDRAGPAAAACRAASRLRSAPAGAPRNSPRSARSARARRPRPAARAPAACPADSRTASPAAVWNSGSQCSMPG